MRQTLTMTAQDTNLEYILNKMMGLTLPNIVNGELVSYLCAWDSEIIKPEDLIKHYKEYHELPRRIK